MSSCDFFFDSLTSQNSFSKKSFQIRSWKILEKTTKWFFSLLKWFIWDKQIFLNLRGDWDFFKGLPKMWKTNCFSFWENSIFFHENFFCHLFQNFQWNKISEKNIFNLKKFFFSILFFQLFFDRAFRKFFFFFQKMTCILWKWAKSYEEKSKKYFWATETIFPITFFCVLSLKEKFLISKDLLQASDISDSEKFDSNLENSEF